LEGTTVLGFARSSPWKSRGGYRATCEVGAYVREEFQGRGIAKALYEEFLPAVQASGFHTALAGIALPNPASIALHEAFGFHHVGTLPEVGRKFEQWISVGYWARTFA
jgi:phosphinothricin acetyltransferase